MPYSGISDPDLPKRVKTMSEHDRRIFVSVFNNAIKEYNGDEGKAFATAYAALKKEGNMDVEKVGRRHSQKDIDAMKQMVIMLGELIGQEEAEHTEEVNVTEKKIDPDVGGGVDRSELESGDFVFPSDRSFPVVTAGDVMDAVHSFGRSKGKSFDDFKRKLIALCRRKGFMDALPESWKKDLKKDDVEKAENLDRKSRDIRTAFMKQFGFDKDYSQYPNETITPKPWITEVWDEYVIVCIFGGEYEPMFFKSNYTAQDDTYLFDAPGNWEQVEQVWQVMPNQKFYVQIGKMSEEKQLVYGVVLKPEPFVDSQGDVMTKAEIEVAAHNFMEQSRLYDLFHKDSLSAKCAVPVESYIAPQDLDWGGKVIPAGSWVVVTHITDANIWKKIKKGEINAYSIRGIGRREGV